MDRIFGISKALDYIEQHITEPTDYEAIAKCAYCSNFHFQRIFSVICDMTIGDYVRMRRLALAGEELSAENGQKALKYFKMLNFSDYFALIRF